MGWIERLYSNWLQRFRYRYGLSGIESSSARSVGWGGPTKWLTAEGKRSFLHVGCGKSDQKSVAPGFRGEDWIEVRLDMDAAVAPDIVASMVDMSVLPDAAFDAIFSSHNIEHLYPHEVPLALAEFYRVLKQDGFLVLTCPDLRSICGLVVEDKLDAPAYTTDQGEPIAPIDVLFGHRAAMARGNLFMAHRCGFTQRTLMETVRKAGFAIGHSLQRPAAFDLWLLAYKNEVPKEFLLQRAREFLPLQQ